MTGGEDRSGSSSGSDHERTVREIRDRFLEGVPDRLATFRSALDEIRRGPADTAPVRELWRQAHNLAGTASSFGLSILAREARSLEGLAEGWSEAEQVPEDGPASARRHVAVLEDRCRALLEQEGHEPG